MQGNLVPKSTYFPSSVFYIWNSRSVYLYLASPSGIFFRPLTGYLKTGLNFPCRKCLIFHQSLSTSRSHTPYHYIHNYTLLYPPRRWPFNSSGSSPLLSMIYDLAIHSWFKMMLKRYMTMWAFLYDFIRGWCSKDIWPFESIWTSTSHKIPSKHLKPDSMGLSPIRQASKICLPWMNVSNFN